MLERLFGLKQRGANLRTEAVAGTTTFMTMAYIIFVNPGILSKGHVPFDAAVTATCIAAGVATLAMGLYANYPFALAAGMGMNVFVAVEMTSKLGSWQAAMAIIVVEGLIIAVLVLTRVREWVMNAIPMALKLGIGVGIGLFIAFIGLKQGRIIQPSQATFIELADPRNAVTLVTAAGLFITVALMALRLRAAILLGILITAGIALAAGLIHYQGVFHYPHFPETFGQIDFSPLGSRSLALLAWAFVFSSMMVDFFDTMGTVIAVGEEGGFLSEGRLPRLRRVLLVDSLAASLGGIFGASSNTTYIESAAGVAEGGRTGLTSVITSVFFFLAIFFSPLVAMVGGGVRGGPFNPVTAPALIVVGFLMMSAVRWIAWDNVMDAFPAFLIIIGIPLTNSISHGIGLGFIAYAAMRILSGKWRELSVVMLVLSVLFAASFVVR